MTSLLVLLLGLYFLHSEPFHQRNRICIRKEAAYLVFATIMLTNVYLLFFTAGSLPIVVLSLFSFGIIKGYLRTLGSTHVGRSLK